MAACEGALLLIDATQGVEAQTVSNTYLAIDSSLEIIPILNKIDMPNANINDTKSQVKELLGVDEDEILSISAKSGEGVNEIFSKVIEKIPHPENTSSDKLSGLIFDSYFDQYRGVVIYVKIISGEIKKGAMIKFFKYDDFCEVIEVGILELKKKSTKFLKESLEMLVMLY